MKKRIMVVEDEAIVRLDLTLILSDAGFEIAGEAADGEKAIELAHELQPDLIIMDIKMPKLNGLKASEIISKSLNIPILLLTAYSQREFIEKAKQANIIGYIVKPVTEASLIPAVEIALKQAENARTYKLQVEEMNIKLKNRMIIEKAKGILMKKLNLQEDAAYSKMRSISMKKQMTLERVAEKIIARSQSELTQK